jgi:hypothetical protein
MKRSLLDSKERFIQKTGYRVDLILKLLKKVTKGSNNAKV